MREVTESFVLPKTESDEKGGGLETSPKSASRSLTGSGILLQLFSDTEKAVQGPWAQPLTERHLVEMLLNTSALLLGSPLAAGCHCQVLGIGSTR